MKHLFARGDAAAAMKAATPPCGSPAAWSGNEKKAERLIR